MDMDRHEYFVCYWDTEGRQVGMRVFAYSFADAEAQARSMPNFSMLGNLPERID